MSKLSRFRPILKSWQFWLFVITTLAVAMRLFPALRYAAWGNDFGIYLGLTKTFLETGEFFNPYYGWGSSYNQFPILYVLTGAVSMLTGLDVLYIMPRLIPIFGGLCVFVFYFVVYELTHERTKSLLAAGLLAVLPFHVYQTSHVAPLTLGHFFFILSIYLFIKSRSSWKYAIPLVASTLLLVMTHHLTTYMFIISLVFIIFSENFSSKEWLPSFKGDMVYLCFASFSMFMYWKFFATIVFNGFMVNGLGFGDLGSEITVGMFYLGVGVLFSFVVFRRRIGLFFDKKAVTATQAKHLFFVSMIILAAIILTFTLVPIPWQKSALTLSFTTLPWALPLMAVISFAVAGFGTIRFIRQGSFVRGWMLGLLVSLVGTTLLGSAMEYHRHFEYLMMPVAIIAVYGIALFLENYAVSDLHIRNPFGRRLVPRDLIYVVIIVLLIVGNGSSTYPSYKTAITYHEDITDDNIDVVLWLAGNVSVNGTRVASDHRIERMAEAFGFNTTHNNMTNFWNTSSVDVLLEHNISYVILDSYMVDDENGVFSYPDHYYMTNDSIEKFMQYPFFLMYQNTSVNEETNELHWTRVYRVDW